jgi:putative membrane protein
MPTTSDAAGERRLHPLSWLFVLLQQLKSFAIPLLILLLGGKGGRGDTWELWGLVGVGVLALLSLAQYFTYRFRVTADGLEIRSGVLQRSLRNIPWQRVHNVALHQTILHRVFGVAEVRLESAGGMRPEAEMRVLSLADAQALEALIRGETARAADATADAAAEPETRVLLELPTSEVVRLGLISNRGMLLVAAAIGVLAQANPKAIGRLVEGPIGYLIGWGRSAHLGVAGWVLGALALLVLFAIALRLLSIVHSLLKFHGFVLSESGRRLSVRRGLLTRVRTNMPRRRIQAWSLQEGLVHRWFGRRSLRVDSASIDHADGQRSLRDLAPVATPDAIDALIRHLLPAAAWPPQHWRPLHPHAWRRQFALPAAIVLIVTGALAFREGLVALSLLALLPLLLARAKVWARHAGYSLDGDLVAVREGWLERHWRFAETRKLHSLKLVRSPFDRRAGMATLLLDTAGANPFEQPLRIRYLPEAEARALHDRLAAAMDRAPGAATGVTPARTAASAAPAA